MWDSPFVVPVAAFIAWAVVVAIKSKARYEVRKLQSQERLAAIEKGIPVPEEVPSTPEEVAPKAEKNPSRRIAYLRTAGLVCVSLGVGTVAFFWMLARVLDTHEMLCGSAAGLFPLAIGVGCLIDVASQKKDLARAVAAAPAAASAEHRELPPPYQP